MNKQKVNKKSAQTKPPEITVNMERAVGISVEQLRDLYVLDGLKGLGPQALKRMTEEGLAPAEIIRKPNRLEMLGKRGEKLRRALENLEQKDVQECEDRARRQIQSAYQNGAGILTYSNPQYPRNVYKSNNAIPILYVRGALEVLSQPKAVAVVGTRSINPWYASLARTFVEVACQEGYTIVSGFALGADTIGHVTAWKSGGNTICVMPSGLDRPFPPENKPLWKDLLAYEGAVFVSEFPFGRSASSLTLRKRNKLIVAFADGVIVAQSSTKGGAMNAYRFAIQQDKPIATFPADGSIGTSGNEAIAQARPKQAALFSVSGYLQNQEDFHEWLLML